MVKKKVKKEVFRGKVAKKTAKKNSVSRKDFETFKFGVQRLNELKKELKSLDTRGFFKEEQDIIKRLENVSEIPVIERKLLNLKLKINNRENPKSIKKRPNLVIIENL